MDEDLGIVEQLRKAMADWRAMPEGPEKDRVGLELEKKISGVVGALDSLIPDSHRAN
jgi:hypothetical protein